VTDDLDRILLMNILSKFYTDEILDDDYVFSSSGIYRVPEIENKDNIMAYIESLPLTEEPEVFGMHQNANITYQKQESEKILSTILDI
jgi:dynein heavy chain